MQKRFLSHFAHFSIVLILLFGLGVQTRPITASPVPATEIVVNSTGDEPDFVSGGVCETATGNGICTLRAAIDTANVSPLGRVITFDIPGPHPFGFTVIDIFYALPILEAAGTIIEGPNFDGSNIVLDGNSGSFQGLEIRADNCAIKNLIIANFDDYGIVVNCPACAPVIGTLITGNMIGDQIPFGVDIKPNGGGIRLNNARSSVIGGDTTAEQNIIAGNAGPGISIQGGDTNVIKGNFIGLKSDGVTAMPNSHGIWIYRSSGNIIGGNTALRRNIISGNNDIGVFIDEASDNVVTGNYIGTNEMGDAAVPNGDLGVRIGNCSTYSYRNRVGGFNPGEANLISGNTDAGIGVYCSDEAIIRGNVIGLNASQSAALPNEWGIVVGSSLNTFIGGAISGAGNVISGNTQQGILVGGTGAINASIKGNRIGVNSAGDAFGNGMDGILVQYAPDVPIGGPGLAANTIAYNGDNGIELEATYAQVGGNSIYNNSALGIDVWRIDGQQGVTPNDSNDDDDLQNFPQLTSMSFPSAGVVKVQGYVYTSQDELVDIYIYGNSVCDPSGHGEGQVYLDKVQSNSGVDEKALFSLEFPLDTSAMCYTATAYTVRNGNSEFSECLAMFGVYLPMIMK